MPNLTALESLRGYMAWLVVAGHSSFLVGLGSVDNGFSLPKPVLQVIQSTDSAVRIFIVLSGFAIGNLILTKREPYQHYIVRRALRIFPIYLFCMFVALLVSGYYAIAYIENPLTNSETQALRVEAQSRNFYQHLLLHLTLLHGLVPNSVLPYSETAFLAPAWTISLEWQFYVLAPAIVWGLRSVSRSGSIFWITVATLASVKAITLSFGRGWDHESMLLLAMDYFLLGILCRIAIGEILKGRTVELMASVVICTLIVGWKEAALWSIFFLISLTEIGLLNIRSRSFRVFSWIIAFNPISRALGRWSYSTYLIHVPVLSVVFGVYLSRRNSADFSQNEAILLAVISCSIVLVLSFLLFRFIEKPFIDFGRKLFKKGSDALIGK